MSSVEPITSTNECTCAKGRVGFVAGEHNVVCAAGGEGESAVWDELGGVNDDACTCCVGDVNELGDG